ncbi:MerR family transcriptional regulator [Rhodococcoides trifolii]|uniref:MerR family transcriptional regulator n=1 Tax=Rhodococcoides trifolii TaxID=908250 RepID=UPI001668CAD9|nr:MerR family transcriptional regulator [Rhodococcus trifolii]
MEGKRTVGAVASLVGISVRTLHHYDEIGLVVPSSRTSAGYRTYSDTDVERLYSVLSYRALGFPLEEIQVLLDDPSVDAVAHLRRQRSLLDEQIEHLQSMATALDRLLEENEMGNKLSPEDQREIWGDNWPGEEYEAEAQERWGDTEAWKQSQAYTSNLTKDDWKRIKAETDALETSLAKAMTSGVAPGTDEANALAEDHRASIERYYACDHRMHVTVSSLYVSDDRFRKHYDDVAPGLAQWLVDVVNANARGHGVEV